ncbi:MAG TPA: hypothetical protein PLN21_09135 [Gemmatales bacterium]|nr:hypothetical protein [Gemmatales bacterium]
MWRFVGFVILVIAGLAGVFYYKGFTEETKAAQAFKKPEQRQVKSVIEMAKEPVVVVNPNNKTVSNIRRSGSIIIPAELKPKEEQEVTFEIENATASILDIPKDIGADVKPGDTLVKMEDIMAKARLDAQIIQATELSDSKIRAAENALDVYVKEVIRTEPLVKQGAASQADFDLALARREQARQDIVKAKCEKKFEEARLAEISQQYKLYEIKSRINGTIVKVFKKKGASVRTSEPILHIINDKQLTVDGAFESGFSDSLKKGMTVILEPENDREARFVYNGHTGSVTGLAMAPQARFLASSSDDSTVVLWDLQSSSTLPWFRLERNDHRRVACKCVAVSPAVNKDTYQILAGYVDGSIYQWTIKLDGNQAPQVETKVWEKAHEQAVNCISFRGDGNYVVSGSDDRRVALWNVAEGKRLYWVQAEATGSGSTHAGAVTSAIFSKDGQYLLTTGTDNSIRRWKLGAAKDGSELVKASMGRTGDVSKINLADDGRFILAEQGDELRVLDSTTLEPVSVINSRRSGRFVQFAQLSPNGQWAVAATDQGRNLLIRLPKLPEAKKDAFPTPVSIGAAVPGKTPATTAPSVPVSTPAVISSTDHWLQDGSIGAHFTLPEAVKATSAVFLTTASQSYVFMGSSDNKIRVWVLPTVQELTSPLLAKLVFKSPQVESGTGLIRVQAEFDNTGARKLETGKRVTMIVYPDANDQK